VPRRRSSSRDRTATYVYLARAQWAALAAVAPNGRIYDLAALLIHRHVPRSARAAAEVLESLLLADRTDARNPIDGQVRLTPQVRARLDDQVDALLCMGYRPDEASLRQLIRAILFRHTPETSQHALDLWKAERTVPAAVTEPTPATLLAHQPTVLVSPAVSPELARRIELAKFELSADPRRRLDRLLLGGLIWAHADPRSDEQLDALMGDLVEYEAVASASVRDPVSVAFRIPVSLEQRLDAIATAIYWRSVPGRRFAGALLTAHVVSGADEDPAGFERLTKTIEEYATTGGFPGHGSAET
jgi:hypothetical protein